MNIDDLTLGQVKDLQKLLSGPTSMAPKKVHPDIGKYVVARTYAAGVHVGVLDDYCYETCHARLSESRRIWSWEGAFTLSAVANDGPTGGKIAQELPVITLSRVEEIIPCSDKSEKLLRKFKVHKS